MHARDVLFSTRYSVTSDFKVKVVLQLISGEKSLADICREYKPNQQMVSRWITEFLQNAPSIAPYKLL